ncbi:hypothetical protein [Alteribacillus bidgolensis]|nr:hypothetical protein [Alteribacillus bidgolensis]
MQVTLARALTVTVKVVLLFLFAGDSQSPRYQKQGELNGQEGREVEPERRRQQHEDQGQQGDPEEDAGEQKGQRQEEEVTSKSPPL